MAIYLRTKPERKNGIVVCNIGDGSMACGPVWEGLMMATMDQYNNLWEGDMKGGLPLLVNVMNNQYAMGGQTRGETMGYDMLARIGAGVNADQMHAERIDGYDPLAVIEAMGRKLEILRGKKGPVLLDTLTYRYSGHSPSDADSAPASKCGGSSRGGSGFRSCFAVVSIPNSRAASLTAVVMSPWCARIRQQSNASWACPSFSGQQP